MTVVKIDSAAAIYDESKKNAQMMSEQEVNENKKELKRRNRWNTSINLKEKSKKSDSKKENEKIILTQNGNSL